MQKRTITTDFFTTISLKSFLRSLGSITFKLPVLKYGKQIKKLENNFAIFLGVEKSKIYSLYNGRSALYQALKIIGVKKTDEIIVSGYTCVSVSNAVIQSGGKIVYSDINNKNLGFNVIELEKNISKKTKVIIVQHTFGKASNIKKIVSIAKKYGIIVIEDCAHSLGTSVGGKKLGTYGDISIFSTSRDKVFSSVSGGLLVINNQTLFKSADEIYSKLKMPSCLLTIRNHYYNIIGYKAYLTYDLFKLGRVIIHIARKFKLITDILTQIEKECKYKDLNYKLPNSLAYLGVKGLEELKGVTTHRRSIAEYYEDVVNNKNFKVLFKILKNEKDNYFRLPIVTKNEKQALKLYVYMRMNGVLLGKTWSYNNIVPFGTINKNAKYKKGTCPIAEDLCKRILLLPNHRQVTPNEAKRIVKLLNNYGK